MFKFVCKYTILHVAKTPRFNIMSYNEFIYRLYANIWYDDVLHTMCFQVDTYYVSVENLSV